VAEAVAALHHLDAAAAHQLAGGEAVDALAHELDGALGHVAALRQQQVGDGLERGGLAGAVGAEQGHDGALRHGQRHALQHEDDVVVDDLDVVQGEDRRGRILRGMGSGLGGKRGVLWG
jgi:hypothetical protein